MQKISLAVAAATLVLLSACGPKTESSPAASASAPEAVAVASAAEAAPENTLGKGVFNKTCSLCHAAGVGGAPKPGDKADWGPRIAQGMDLLFKHATEGFTGAKGMMPARGGNPALTDDEIKAAINYMADKSR
ncbi:MAG: cytochrome c5 family protein [Burkholderiales bacterium]|nr:cytochrome c5 family protein [Burkholderiales bacterium]